MIPPWFLPKSRLILPWARIGLVLIPTWLLSTAVAGESRTGTTPARISLAPTTIALVGGRARQQVAVTGHYDDGSVRDLTYESRFTVVPPGLADASSTGVVRPGAEGEGRLVVEAGGRIVEATVHVARADWVRPFSYRHDVVALLSKAGCNMGACHGNLNGKGGFRLSLRGDDPGFDLVALTRDTLGRRIDRNVPGQSLAVLKPTGQLPHEGGPRFPAASAEAATLLGWIAAGAMDDAPEVPKLKRLTVFPNERIAAAPALTQQLVVTAEFADGSSRDVTRQASYDVSDPTRATVTVDGRVVRMRPARRPSPCVTWAAGESAASPSWPIDPTSSGTACPSAT